MSCVRNDRGDSVNVYCNRNGVTDGELVDWWRNIVTLHEDVILLSQLSVLSFAPVSNKPGWPPSSSQEIS